MTNREKRIESIGKKKTSELSILECLDILVVENSWLDCTLEGLGLDANDDDLLQALQDEVYYGLN